MKTFTVIGLGRFGTSVATQLFNMGYEVLAIDKNMDKINAIANLVTRAACTDAKDESLLKQLGVKNSDCAIVCIGGDDITDSVLTTLALKDMGVKQVVCKAKDNMHKTVLKKVGADNVIIPEQEAGIKAAIELVSDRYSIVDAVVPNTWIGKSIMELSVRKKYNVNIVAIKSNNGGKVNISPEPEYKFKDTDIVVLVGDIESINRLESI